MYTALLLAVGSLSFGGGSPDALAEAYHKAFDEPVAIVAISPELPAMEVDGATALVRNARIAARSPLRRAHDHLNSLSFDAWPKVTFEGRDGGTEYEERFPLAPEEALRLKDGRVTFAAEADRYLSMQQLTRRQWSRPVTVHWILTRLRLAVRAHEVPEERFLRMVAAAVGGRLVADPKHYQVLPDVEVYRRTRIAAIESEPLQSGAFPRAKRDVRIDVLRAVDASDLTRSIRAPDAITELVVVPGTPVGEAVARFARTFEALSGPERPDDSAPSSLFPLIDPRGRALVRLDANGAVFVVFSGFRPGQGIAP